MKAYPSIQKDVPAFNAYVFDKIDGSNLRFEYSKKRKWYKSGTRTRLFDQTDPVFGSAIKIFNETLAMPLEGVFHDNRIEQAVVFTEFWGPSSFAGQHASLEPHMLYLLDVSVYKKGFIDPKEFLKLFGKFPIPNYLGYMRWNTELVEKVHNNLLPGVTFEGIVGKSGGGTDFQWAKAKTYQWLEKVKSLYSPEYAERLINS